VDRPYGALAWIAQELGQYDEARRLAAQWKAEVPIEAQGGRDRLALVEQEIAFRAGRLSATDEARLRAITDSLPCGQCAALQTGRLYDLAGREDSALALYERGVPYPGDADRIWEDGFVLPRAYKRLGELYEKRGNRAKALEYYGRFVELWRDADPALQPAVREVRQRMAELSAEPR
jgi:tetratricopeptide (TPR) repeat protein